MYTRTIQSEYVGPQGDLPKGSLLEAPVQDGPGIDIYTGYTDVLRFLLGRVPPVPGAPSA